MYHTMEVVMSFERIKAESITKMYINLKPKKKLNILS